MVTMRCPVVRARPCDGQYHPGVGRRSILSFQHFLVYLEQDEVRLGPNLRNRRAMKRYHHQYPIQGRYRGASSARVVSGCVIPIPYRYTYLTQPRSSEPFLPSIAQNLRTPVLFTGVAGRMISPLYWATICESYLLLATHNPIQKPPAPPLHWLVTQLHHHRKDLLPQTSHMLCAHSQNTTRFTSLQH